MFTCRSFIGAVALWASTAFPSWADDFALILTNRDYDRVADATDAADYRAYAETLRKAGFRVFGGESWVARSMTDAASEFRNTLDRAQVDRVVVVVSGRMAAGPTDTWLLARDYRTVDALNIGQYALSLSTLADMLEAHPGKALMVVAPSLGGREPLGTGLQGGVKKLPLPQGMAMMRGRADKTLPVLRDRVLGRSEPLGQLATVADLGVSLSGYLPVAHPLGGSGGNPAPQPVDADSAYWSAARDIGTVEAYRAYLNRFPRGLFAAEARRLIDDILQQPARQAEAVENALNLSRDARREVQRQLTLLGFSTRGIDGIFGAGSRAAIAAYQRSKGWADTGYLDAALIDTLRRDAQARARQLEEEERQRRIEQERLDRDYWDRTGSGGTEDGLRQYLRRFPDGLYADIARERLEFFERGRRDRADQQMRAAWDETRRLDTVEAYRAFIARYQRSEFVEAAQDRIEELEAEDRNRDQIERDKAEEAIVAGNPVARLFVERALQSAGLNTGEVDGEFDRKTRRAIRQFQRATDLPVTGFVSQATMVRLMTRARP